MTYQISLLSIITLNQKKRTNKKKKKALLHTQNACDESSVCVCVCVREFPSFNWTFMWFKNTLINERVISFKNTIINVK